MHEMVHFSLDVLFNNNANPYTEDDKNNLTSRFLEYENAAIETLKNIAVKLLQENVSNPVFNQSLANIAIYLQIPIFTKILIATAFQPSSYNWSNDDFHLLKRISDYVYRSPNQYASELLPRLPELQVEGLSKKTLVLLKPLTDYWQFFITPKVNEVVAEHVTRCETELKYGNSSKRCVLDLNLSLLSNPYTKCKIIKDVIRGSAYENGTQSLPLLQKRAGQELISSINNNKQSECIKIILSNFNITSQDTNKAFEQATKNGNPKYIHTILKSSVIDPGLKTTHLKSLISENLCWFSIRVGEFLKLINEQADPLIKSIPGGEIFLSVISIFSPKGLNDTVKIFLHGCDSHLNEMKLTNTDFTESNGFYKESACALYQDMLKTNSPNEIIKVVGESLSV